MNTPLISIVSPVYKARNIIPELVVQIENSVLGITNNFEIILVDDGCPENSWEIIEEIAKNNPNVIGIKLSRNFGQHYAISAGLSEAKGEWIVVMDCDLQDRPDEIPNLFKKAIEGYDIVFAQRQNRKDGYFKKLFSKLFHKFYSWLSGINSDSSIANFGIYNAKVISEYNKMMEISRSFPSLIGFLGFNSIKIQVKHSERFEGKSSYNFSKLLNLSFDVILSNSNKPLKLTVKLGFIISVFSFFLAIYNIIAYEVGVIKVVGFTTTVFSIWFVGGLILFVLGIVGLYIGKIFDQVKDRPLFIVAEKLNNK
jgi:glycosyltransferase involved in cell wall biosynthesis